MSWDAVRSPHACHAHTHTHLPHLHACHAHAHMPAMHTCLPRSHACHAHAHAPATLTCLPHSHACQAHTHAPAPSGGRAVHAEDARPPRRCLRVSPVQSQSSEPGGGGETGLCDPVVKRFSRLGALPSRLCLLLCWHLLTDRSAGGTGVWSL